MPDDLHVVHLGTVRCDAILEAGLNLVHLEGEVSGDFEDIKQH